MRIKAAALVVALFACSAVAVGADASGTWSGSIAIHFPDGRVIDDSAWLQLQQRGAQLDGTAGSAPDRQKPIRAGVVAGDELSFVTESTSGKELRFALRLAGEKLAGEAQGEIGADRVRVSVELARVPVAGTHDALFEEISACDARLFDAYNRRDVAGVMAMFTKDLEFYHDRGGLSGYAQNRENFRHALTEATRHRRELVPGTLQVSRLGETHALETGIHRFYDTPPGEQERLAATAQFVNVWQRGNGDCKLRRVISFDHR